MASGANERAPTRTMASDPPNNQLTSPLSPDTEPLPTRHSSSRAYELAGYEQRQDKRLVRTRSKQELGARGAETRHKWQSIGALAQRDEPLLQRANQQVSDGFERLRKGYASMRKSFRLPAGAGKTRFDCQQQQRSCEYDTSESLRRNLIGQIGQSAAKLLRGVVYSRHALDSIESSTKGSFKVLSSGFGSHYGELAPQRAKSDAEREIEHRLRRSKRRVLPSASYRAPNSELACEGLNLDELEAIKRDNLRLTLRSQQKPELARSSDSLVCEQNWIKTGGGGDDDTAGEPAACSCKSLSCDPDDTDRQHYCSCASFSSSFSSIHQLLDCELGAGGRPSPSEQQEAQDHPRASGGLAGETMIEDKLRRMFHSLGEFKFARNHDDDIESAGNENDHDETLVCGETTRPAARSKGDQKEGERTREPVQQEAGQQVGADKEDLKQQQRASEGGRPLDSAAMAAAANCGGQDSQPLAGGRQIRLANKCNYEPQESDADRAARNCCLSLGGVTLAQIASQQVSNSLHCSPVNDDDPDESDCPNDAQAAVAGSSETSSRAQRAARAGRHAIELAPLEDGATVDAEESPSGNGEAPFRNKSEPNESKPEQQVASSAAYSSRRSARLKPKQDTFEGADYEATRQRSAGTLTGTPRGSAKAARASTRSMLSFSRAELWRQEEERELAIRRHLKLCDLSEQLRRDKTRYAQEDQHLYASIRGGSDTPSPERAPDDYYQQHPARSGWRDELAYLPSQFAGHDKQDLFSKQLESTRDQGGAPQTTDKTKDKTKRSLFSRLKHLIGQPNAAKTAAKEGRAPDCGLTGGRNKALSWQKSATLRSKSTQNLLGHSLRYLSSSRKSMNLVGARVGEREEDERLDCRMINSGFLTLGRRLRANERCIVSQLCDHNANQQQQAAIERHYWAAFGGSADSLHSADSGLSCGNLQNSGSSDENYAALHQARPTGNLYTEGPAGANRASLLAPAELRAVGRARAKVDCNPCAYDKEALVFKRGDIIDILERHPSGTWLGRCGDQVGHFKFINVAELREEPARQQEGPGKGTFVTKLEIRSGNISRDSDRAASIESAGEAAGNKCNRSGSPSTTINRRSLSMNTISYSSAAEPAGSRPAADEPIESKVAAGKLGGSDETIMSSLEQLLFAIGLAGEQVNSGSGQANTTTAMPDDSSDCSQQLISATDRNHNSSNNSNGNPSVVINGGLGSSSYLDVLNKGGISSLDSFSAIDDWRELEQIGIVDDEHKRRLLMAARIIRQASRAAKLDFVENYRPSKDAIRSADSADGPRKRSENLMGDTKTGALSERALRSGHINEPIYVNLLAVNRSSGSAESIVSQLDRVQDLDPVHVGQVDAERVTTTSGRLSAHNNNNHAELIHCRAGEPLIEQTKQHRRQRRASHATAEQKGKVLNLNLINQFDHYHSRYSSTENPPQLAKAATNDDRDWNDDDADLDDQLRLDGELPQLTRGYSVRVNGNNKSNPSRRGFNHPSDLERGSGRKAVAATEGTLLGRFNTANRQRDEGDSGWSPTVEGSCDGGARSVRVSTERHRLAAGDKRSGFDCNKTLVLNADLEPRSEFSRRELCEQYQYHQQKLKQQHDNYSAVARIPTGSRHFKQHQDRNVSRQDDQKASYNSGSQINNSKSAYDLRLDLSHFFY